VISSGKNPKKKFQKMEFLMKQVFNFSKHLGNNKRNNYIGKVPLDCVENFITNICLITCFKNLKQGATTRIPTIDIGD
jgi:hypothetical protein